MNQLWSVAIEDHRKSLNQLFLQPFLAYTAQTHTTFTLGLEMTTKWNNTPGDAKWTVPLIFSVSQVLKLGHQPVSIQVGGKYYADTPRYRPGLGCPLCLYSSLSHFQTKSGSSSGHLHQIKPKE